MTGPTLRPLPSTDASATSGSMATRVSSTIRDAIVAGLLLPGTRLLEIDLARQLGVSPTPVREALRQLEIEGMVESHPYRGTSVARISIAEIDDLYDVHEVLECHAVALACQASTRDPSDLDRLLLQQIQAIRDGDLPEFNRLDLRFHETLNAHSGNATLVTLILQVHRRIQTARHQMHIELAHRPASSVRQHRAIRDAWLDGDVDAATRFSREHIRSNRDAVRAVATKGDFVTRDR